MGLKSGKTGVKAQLKERYPQAFRDFPELIDARDAALATREQTVGLVDGNVIMMSVPMSCRTLDSYVCVIYTALLKVLAVTAVTVVVFDEPVSMTEAKRQEQSKRDAARSATAVPCSGDLKVVENDDYDKQYISTVTDVHVLKSNRGTRMRFYDEVATQVLDRLKARIAKWNAAGHAGGALFLDGVDPRGASRGIGEERCARMLGTDEGLLQQLQRNGSIGEGDLKLGELGRRIREMSLSDGSFHKVRLLLTSTIDTDSFAIELIEEVRRRTELASCTNTLLCMRERARKRGREDDRDGYYTVCDVTMLQELLQRAMWGIGRSPTPVDQRAAMTLMVAGWGLCGCDFVELKGMRSDLIFDTISEIVKTRPDSLALMRHSWAGTRETLELTHRPIRELLLSCASRLADIPRVKKEAAWGIRNPNDVVLKRAGWLSAYWNACEYAGDMGDFGFFKPFG